MKQINDKQIDLLKECPYGGCSAKMDPHTLHGLLDELLPERDERVMVDISTHDDAGVFRLNDETALIFTTDFFPPMVADPYTFGAIAASNALSDVYAMGGKPLLSLNLVHYPSNRLPVEGLVAILKGGQDKINEAHCLTMGGHTIDDQIPQYGLAVLGTVHPDRLISNAGAQAGDALILTKPLGIGTLIAAHRLDMVGDKAYRTAIAAMMRLNASASVVMQRYGATAATDVTGFGLVGHARGMAKASGCTLSIDVESLPVLDEVLPLLKEGCIPGACFRNLKFVGDELRAELPFEYKYLCADPQTSGGLLFSVAAEKAEAAVADLHAGGDTSAAIVGTVLPPQGSACILQL